MLVVHQLNIKIQKIGGMPSMKEYKHIAKELGLIVLIVVMPFFFIAIFFSSFFLDTTPVTNTDSHKVDHTKSKIWEGMSKNEYQRIKDAEEEKKSNYVDYEDEPTFDPNETSSFNLYEVENKNDEYEKYLPN
ncbi:hypothetical protein ABEY41_19100 [Peribacillus butanolivorans]|uniref:hypothetical protein n=1 Tax=Peribacillus butanolivorans TaxID=421767 RepID=UPI003D2A95BA